VSCQEEETKAVFRPALRMPPMGDEWCSRASEVSAGDSPVRTGRLHALTRVMENTILVSGAMCKESGMEE